jgi:hypothetical protein
LSRRGISGLGKGLLGVVTKPAVGALDFTAKTLQGLGKSGEAMGAERPVEKAKGCVADRLLCILRRLLVAACATSMRLLRARTLIPA